MCRVVCVCVWEREKGKGFGLAFLIQWKHFRHKKSQLRERKKEREEERNVPGRPPAPLWITAIFVLFYDEKETHKLKPSECFAVTTAKGREWKYFTCDHLWENVDHEQGFPLHKKNPTGAETIHLKGWSQKQKHISHRISVNKTDRHVLIVKNLIKSCGLSHIHPQVGKNSLVYECILYIYC